MGAAEGRICFRVSASGGLLWWELQRRKRDGQRVGDVLGAGVVGGEFEAGRVFFSRVWLGMDVLVGTAAPESGADGHRWRVGSGIGAEVGAWPKAARFFRGWGVWW